MFCSFRWQLVIHRERNPQAFFPNSATYADPCRFVCIYPAYVNAM
jgi:hypothetical protein